MAQKILIIQTAFIGDVVLATAILESIHQQNPAASISILVRKGNEALLNAHPFIDQVLVWDKNNINMRIGYKSFSPLEKVNLMQ